MAVPAKFETVVQKIKYEVLKEVAKQYWDGTIEHQKDNIPYMISPDANKATMRCCVYKEREIVRERVKLALGGNPMDKNILEVIEPACGQCPFGGMTVTDLCRGCLAHRCEQACRIKAISFDEFHHAHIDKSKCVNCGLCMKACQFEAIINRVRPCEKACKINAIHQNDVGIAEIDADKCTRCGQCSYACPFGAIMDKSFMTRAIDLLKTSQNNEKFHVYLIVAPAFFAAAKGPIVRRILGYMKAVGFYQVVEAALGADMVALSEAEDLVKEGSATSSCCPAFVSYISTAFPELRHKISRNFSPMAAICKAIKTKDPKAKTIFVGPCTAKKMEMQETRAQRFVDCVLTFEELQALIDSRGIPEESITPLDINDASYFGRIFAHGGGLSDAAAQAIRELGVTFEFKPVKVTGLDNCRTALNQMKNGKLDGNFLEGMACPGGCIGGPSCFSHTLSDAAAIDAFAKTSNKDGIKDSVAKNGVDPSLSRY